MFLGSHAIENAVLTPNQLRSPAWIRLRQNVYADSRADRTHRLACQAVAMRLPDTGAFAGPSAAYLLGVEHAADFGDPVHIVVPSTVRSANRRGLRVHHVALAPSDVGIADALPCTTPLRTVWDLASWLDLIQSVPIIDSMLGQGLVTVDALGRYVEVRKGERGWRRASRAIELADGRSQSAPESRLRVRLVLDGFPPPTPQFPVQIGLLTLHPDLAWPEFKVAVEYDGVWHEDPDQSDFDRRRLNRLTAAGWIVVTVTNELLRRDAAAVLREIRRALVSRGWNG